MKFQITNHKFQTNSKLQTPMTKTKSVVTTAGLLYQAKSLAELPWIQHGFGTRGVTLDEYLHYFGHKQIMSVCTRQIHSNHTHILDEGAPPLLEGDAFITADKGKVCFVRTADCVPILLCDEAKHIVAAVHAGWRGMAGHIVFSAIEEMKQKFGCRPEDLMAAIGPSICKKCYTVGEEVIEEFKKNNFSDDLWELKTDKKQFSLDLGLASQRELLKAGLKRDKITFLPLCTCCLNDEFVSFRRNNQEKSRQINFIFII